jgi:hypothetical protein
MSRTLRPKVFWVNDYTQSSHAADAEAERSKDLLLRTALKLFPSVTACTIERLGLTGKYANRYVFWRHSAGHWSNREMIFSVEENEVDGVLILKQAGVEESVAVQKLSRRAAKIFKKLTVMHQCLGGFLKPVE